MNTEITSSPVRPATMSTFAVLGFVALVAAGLWLAVYSTRFVPAVVHRIGAAAVYVGSVFTPSPHSTLGVVPSPTASSTIPFRDPATTPTKPVTMPTEVKPVAPVTPVPVATTPAPKPATTPTTETPAVSAPTKIEPHGLSDLAVEVVSTGYLTEASTESFVASTTVPYGDRAAVHFIVKNVGTNWSGTWSFSASIPTRPAYTFKSPIQQSLAPGDSIDYTLGFDKAITGPNQVITIAIDPIGGDSNTNNNSTSAGMTVLGS